jgi:hypothetical protein
MAYNIVATDLIQSPNYFFLKSELFQAIRFFGVAEKFQWINKITVLKGIESEVLKNMYDQNSSNHGANFCSGPNIFLTWLFMVCQDFMHKGLVVK